MDAPDLPETEIQLVVIRFPSGVRDFVLLRTRAGATAVPVEPMDLLALDRAAALIQKRPDALGLVLALCRLLIPSLRFRGSGRHIVIEPWNEDDLRGQTLPSDAPCSLARELSLEQARDWEMITSGQSPPAGSLAELCWKAQTELPLLPDRFQDPSLGRFAKSLYLHLVPPGVGMIAVDQSQITRQIEHYRADDFAALELGMSRRKLKECFQKLLAVSVRYAAQLTGDVATELIQERIGSEGGELSEPERALIELRYGACRELGDLNIGFLFRCGPVLTELINDFVRATGLADHSRRADAAQRLQLFMDLLHRFRKRRKLARAQERREDRQRHADRMPHGPRLRAQEQPDPRAEPPSRRLEEGERLGQLRELLPLLKPRDARRLGALIGCQGDRQAAADQLGLPRGKYSQQLRQTTLPAVRRLWRELQGNSGPARV